eukprot:2942182-Rhodomonas_salina.2
MGKSYGTLALELRTSGQRAHESHTPCPVRATLTPLLSSRPRVGATIFSCRWMTGDMKVYLNC